MASDCSLFSPPQLHRPDPATVTSPTAWIIAMSSSLGSQPLSLPHYPHAARGTLSQITSLPYSEPSCGSCLLLSKQQSPCHGPRDPKDLLHTPPPAPSVSLPLPLAHSTPAASASESQYEPPQGLCTCCSHGLQRPPLRCPHAPSLTSCTSPCLNITPYRGFPSATEFKKCFKTTPHFPPCSPLPASLFSAANR